MCRRSYVRQSQSFGEQADLLRTLTAGHVIAILVGTKKQLSDEKSFKYEFDITSPKLSGYIYSVFVVAYDVSMYPSILYLKEDIAKELMIEPEIKVANEEELIKLLEKILKSKTLEILISYLLTLAKEVDNH